MAPILNIISSENNNNYSIFNPPDLTEAELKNICDYINGNKYTDSELMSDILLCGTEAILYVNYYYNQNVKERKSIPTYLLEAYNKINSEYKESYAAKTNEYIISSSGHFKVFYDQAEDVPYLDSLVDLLCSIYDAVDTYLCSVYNLNQPTTDGTYYEIHLVTSDIIGGAEGTTYSLANNRSYIRISQTKLDDFYFDSTDAFVLGTAIHEYMHAILFSYGISYSTLGQICFHESMGRAVGIDYEISYANHYDICYKIRSFISSLGYSLGTVNTDNYKYGGAIFYLFLFEDYDEWTTIQCVLENYNFSISLFDNIDYALDNYYNSSMESAYIHFLSCNVDPDDIYYSSPKNRLASGYDTWGSPYITGNYTVTSTNTTFSSSGSLSYLAGHYIKFTPTVYTGKTVTITVNFSSISGGAIPQGACMLHNASTDNYTYSGGVVINNTFSYSCTLSLTGNDELYLIIANAGTAGTLSYSYSAVVSG